MAGSIEEDFVFREIYNLPRGCNIFEFGCGQNLFINKIVEMGHNVTAVDLYSRTAENKEDRKFNFLKGDFLDLYELFDLGRGEGGNGKYDCIYALSAIEHIGLEGEDKGDSILEWNKAEEKLKNIIYAIWDILRDNGIFLVTLPFGNYGAWYVDKNGNSTIGMDGKIDEGNKKSIWGGRVYDLKDIDSIFLSRFKLICREFYLKTDPKSDYFDRNSWIMTGYDECYKTKEPAGAIVCLKLLKMR